MQAPPRSPCSRSSMVAPVRTFSPEIQEWVVRPRHLTPFARMVGPDGPPYGLNVGLPPETRPESERSRMHTHDPRLK